MADLMPTGSHLKLKCIIDENEPIAGKVLQEFVEETE
jgi:hypothetical protein